MNKDLEVPSENNLNAKTSISATCYATPRKIQSTKINHPDSRIKQLEERIVEDLKFLSQTISKVGLIRYLRYHYSKR